MARKRRNEILAGGFFVFATFLLFLLLVLMGTFESLFKPFKEVQVVFNEVQGLREGDPVYFLGEKVGTVRRLQVRLVDVPAVEGGSDKGPKVSSARVFVTLGLPKEYWELLREDSQVLIDKSITGNLSVLIREGKKGRLKDAAAVGPQPAVLAGSVAFDVVETAARVEETLSKVNRLTEEVASFVENIKVSGHIDNILTDIRSTTEALRKSVGPVTEKVDRIADEIQGIIVENRPGIKASIANIAETTTHLREVLLRRLDPAAQSLENALAQMQKSSKELETLIARNRGNINLILDDLRETSTNAANLSAEVRRRPWKLLYNPSAGEVETFDLYDAAWAYQLAAGSVNRSVQELSAFTAGQSSDPEVGKEVQKAIGNLESSLKRQREAEDSFYTLLKDRLR